MNNTINYLPPIILSNSRCAPPVRAVDVQYTVYRSTDDAGKLAFEALQITTFRTCSMDAAGFALTMAR